MLIIFHRCNFEYFFQLVPYGGNNRCEISLKTTDIDIHRDYILIDITVYHWLIYWFLPLYRLPIGLMCVVVDSFFIIIMNKCAKTHLNFAENSCILRSESPTFYSFWSVVRKHGTHPTQSFFVCKFVCKIFFTCSIFLRCVESSSLFLWGHTKNTGFLCVFLDYTIIASMVHYRIKSISIGRPERAILLVLV